MKLPLFRICVPVLFILSLTSCTPSYHFKVDAISGGEFAPQSSFYLVSANSDMKDSDLRFKEAASFVQTALEGKGLRRASQISSADLLVEIDFGVGEPREVMEYRSYPETYWHPGFSYAIQIPIYNNSGMVVSYQTRLVREPSRSFTHWEDRLDSNTVFEKYLKIEAFDNRLGTSSPEPQQLWSVLITNADPSDNIREYLPFMVAAALPYIGEDTGSQLFTSIREDDPTASFVRNPEKAQLSE